MFVGELLVGLICTVPEHFGSNRLEAVPLDLVLRNRNLAGMLGPSLREPPYLEPVLAGLDRGWEALPEGPGRSPSLLLEARHRVVPFRGREAHLGELEGWCEPAGSPVRLVVGGAGRGKSRLAIELCQRMTARGWICGFLSSKAPTDVLKRVVDFEEPALLVVDYAETRQDLERLLEPLAGTGGTLAPARVLLLARAAGCDR